MGTMSTGKKINYFRGLAELSATTSRNMDVKIGDLRDVTDKAQMAGTDRGFNAIVGMGNKINEVILNSMKVAIEVLEPITKSAERGEAAMQAARQLIPTCEETIAAIREFDKIPESVISSRGLEETWNGAMQEQYKEGCASFITIRRRYIDDLLDLTQQNTAEDMADVYATLGRGIENVSNDTVDDYNRLVAALADMNIMMDTEIAAAEDAAKGVGKVQSAAIDTDLSGGNI